MKKYISGKDILDKAFKGEKLPQIIYDNDNNDYHLNSAYYNVKSDLDFNFNILYRSYDSRYLLFYKRYDLLRIYYYYYDDILDDKEKAYLSNIIKPFKSKVQYIRKNEIYNKIYYIQIRFVEDDDSYGFIALPVFINDTMYKDMNSNINYTLAALNL